MKESWRQRIHDTAQRSERNSIHLDTNDDKSARQEVGIAYPLQNSCTCRASLQRSCRQPPTDNPRLPKITIDGREIELPDGQRINAIEAAKLAGVEIPHYCYHPGLPVVGSCRMCLIETGNRDAKTGEIKMQPKLVPGCTVPASDGLVIVTATEKVRQARAMVEEDLLLRHPVDCPICDKAGECTLQDYYFRYGQASRRTDVMPFTSRKRDLGDVELFIDRCVMCSRCVRFCAEVSGTAELMVANRGAARRNRRRARLPAAQRTLRQRGRPLPRRRAGRQGFSLSAAGLVHAAASGRLHRLLDRLLDLDRGEPGPCLSPQAPRESPCQQVVDLQPGPLRLPSRPRREAAGRPAASQGRQDHRPELEWSARGTEEQAFHRRPAGRRVLAVS